MGREREGDLSLQLLPTECFLSPKIHRAGSASPDREHLGDRLQSKGGKREVVQVRGSIWAAGRPSQGILPLAPRPPSCCGLSEGH